MYRNQPSRICSVFCTCLNCGAQGWAPTIHARFCSMDCSDGWSKGEALLDALCAQLDAELAASLTALNDATIEYLLY